MMMHIFQWSCTWLCIVFNDVLAYIIKRFGDLLFWDRNRLTRETIEGYTAAIEHKGGIKEVWGFINGTMRAICCPDENQEIYYSGYKKCHAVKYQALSTPDSLIIHLARPYTGQERKLQELQLVDDPDLVKRFHIYGDPAYSLSYGIIFNTHMSSLHISVEYEFARLMMLCRYNGFKMVLKIGLSPVAAYFMVSVLFCNIHSCFHGNQTSKKFHCNPPSVHSYLAAA
ncbi:hypothetical protein L873DRAFT_1839327 [Choiromyces venosus 120613-1]|uniref:DDE Tnp4 domain-containing protein n=1 Tax=Choiromyces venosus 120613-1 TaxID=1336337 RepID=A0A3N4J5J0_9PEZI|nr:hypothetical protein L873DRAFT_1839327 [Choiromyces venosus 120613-1]